MSEPTIYKPSVYNAKTIYNTGAGGGGGGNNPIYTPNIALLLNGVTDTEQPVSGGCSPVTDADFPIENLKVYNSNNAQNNNGVYYKSDATKNCLEDTETGWTIDYWFKPIQYKYQATPFYVSFASAIDPTNNDRALSGRYGEDMLNYYYDGFLSNPYAQIQITKGVWSHLCIENKKITSTKDERYCFLNGRLKYHDTNFTHLTWEDLYIKFMLNKNNIIYSIGQFCLRSGIVWTEDFTPPTQAYSLY